MKIITYSDLHLEFGSVWTLPSEVDGDVMILSGDIIVFRDYSPLDRLLRGWNKPVLYIPGNHEYYTQSSINHENNKFKTWLENKHSNVKLLLDEGISIDGVNFFGGTMWTDFDGGNVFSMITAQQQMNDFKLIYNSDQTPLRPEDTILLHKIFVEKLLNWFNKDLSGPHVVISHTAPVINPSTKFRNSPLWPAFNSLDMIKIIEEYQPELWVYGHTHECDNHIISNTRVISNQLGYPNSLAGFECNGFDPVGIPLDLNYGR